MLAAAGSMRLLGPNCLGLFNARAGFYPIFSSSFESGFSPPGRVGIASQSGAYGTHVFAVARNRGIGTPICVTTGNEADHHDRRHHRLAGAGPGHGRDRGVCRGDQRICRLPGGAGRRRGRPRSRWC